MSSKMPPDPLENVSDAAVHRLTDEQRIVCALIARGMTSKAIARLLDVGLRTIEKRRARAASTLGLETGVLIIWAARNMSQLPDELPPPTKPAV
jgi:DNA-binding NarL/FixJ family response regulator